MTADQNSAVSGRRKRPRHTGCQGSLEQPRESQSGRRDIIIAYFTEVTPQHCPKPIGYIISVTPISRELMKSYANHLALARAQLDVKIDLAIHRIPGYRIKSVADFSDS